MDREGKIDDSSFQDDLRFGQTMVESGTVFQDNNSGGIYCE